MAMAGLFALLGPSIGGFTVRYNAYRGVQVLGVLGMAGGFALLALSKGDSFLIVLAVGIAGIGAAAGLVVNPTLIVGAGLSESIQAKQLTSLSILGDVGKILGGVILGGLAAANLSYDARFWVAAAIIAGLAAFVWVTNGRAAKRVVRASKAREAETRAEQPKLSLKAMLLSLFGVVVLAQLLATICGSLVSSQYSNIFSNVFELDEKRISAMVSISGVVGIGLYIVAGIWMGRSGSTAVWATGNALRGLGGLVLAVMGAVGGVPYLAILGAYLLFESTAAFTRIAQAATAVGFAPAAAAVATGWLAAGQALGQSLASVGGGIIAEATGSYEILLWLAGGFGVASAAIGFIVLVPAARRRAHPPVPADEARLHGEGKTEFAP
jgi:hypothetical protein